jgi:superfamily II DNA/RNA helicase
MDCLAAAANKNFDRIDHGLPTDERETAACSATIDKEIQEWKKSHPKKN